MLDGVEVDRMDVDDEVLVELSSTKRMYARLGRFIWKNYWPLWFHRYQRTLVMSCLLSLNSRNLTMRVGVNARLYLECL